MAAVVVLSVPVLASLERLAISPQCGFASVMVGNETDQDAQWRKLELVGRVADRLWGDAKRPGR